MSLPVVIRPEAQAEFDEAADWYERQRAGLGVEFVAQVNAAIDRVAARPEAYAVVSREVRRALVARFPYAVLYRVYADQILIVAIFHARRDPAEWQRRT